MPPRQSGRGAAAAQPALEAPGLLSLPEPLLVRVLSLLDDDAERARAGSVCRALHAATLAPELWTKLTARTPDKRRQAFPGLLLAWLAPEGRLSPRALHLARIDLHLDDFTLGPAAWGSLRAALAAVAATLTHLDLLVEGALDVGAVLTPLEALRSATLQADTLQVLDTGRWSESLLALVSLKLRGYDQNCAPWPDSSQYEPFRFPNLTVLLLSDISLDLLGNRDLIGGLTKLVSLNLMDCTNASLGFSGPTTAFVTKLAVLKDLALPNCRLFELPSALAHLSALRVLDVSSNTILSFGADNESAEVLRSLPELKVFLADKCQMDRLPEALNVCRGLEVLSLPDICCEEEMLPSSLDTASCLSTLTSLSISYDLALECAGRLSAASRLQRLHLCIEGSEEPRLRSKIGGLQGVLAALPALTDLWVFPSSSYRGTPAWTAPRSKRQTWAKTRQLLAYFKEQTQVSVTAFQTFSECVLRATEEIAGLRDELCL